MAVFIAWDIEESDAILEYVGGGYYDTKFVNRRTVTKRARWTNTETYHDIQNAKEYVRREKADGDTKTNMRVIVEDG